MSLLKLVIQEKPSKFSSQFDEEMKLKQQALVEAFREVAQADFAQIYEEEEVDEAAGDFKSRTADKTSKSQRLLKSRNKARGKTAAGNVKKKSNAIKAQQIRRKNKVAFAKGIKKAKKTDLRFK
jgi:hypothetical protein